MIRARAAIPLLALFVFWLVSPLATPGDGGEVRQQGDHVRPSGHAPPPSIDPEAVEQLNEQVRELGQVVEALGKFTEALGPAPAEIDDGVERIFVPCRQIERPPANYDLSLWAGKEFVAVLPHGQPDTFALIDGRLHTSAIPYPSELVFPATSVAQDRGIFLLWQGYTSKGRLPRAVFHIERDRTLRKIIDVDVDSLLSAPDAREASLAIAHIDFFQWGSGYGVLCVGRASTQGKAHRYRSWIIQYDSKFNQTHVFSVPDGRCWAALGVGPANAIAALVQRNSFAFMDLEGTCHVVPVKPAR